jgi:hypothetical protein
MKNEEQLDGRKLASGLTNVFWAHWQGGSVPLVALSRVLDEGILSATSPNDTVKQWHGATHVLCCTSQYMTFPNDHQLQTENLPLTLSLNLPAPQHFIK